MATTRELEMNLDYNTGWKDGFAAGRGSGVHEGIKIVQDYMAAMPVDHYVAEVNHQIDTNLHISAMTLNDLKLDPRTYRALRRGGIHNFDDLRASSIAEIARFRGFGPIMLGDLLATCQQQGIRLRYA